MEVPRDSDEGFLNQVLCLVPIAGLAGNEVNEPVAIPVVQVLERTSSAAKMGDDELLVTQHVEGLFLQTRSSIVVHLRLSHPVGLRPSARTGPTSPDNDSHFRSEYDPSRSHLQGQTRFEVRSKPACVPGEVGVRARLDPKKGGGDVVITAQN